MKTTSTSRLIALAVAVVFLSGCKTTRGISVTRVGEETGPIDTLTRELDMQDIRITAKNLSDQFITSPAFRRMAQQDRVILEMERIANRTDRHLNTDELTSTMRTMMLNTGLVLFTNENTLGRDVEITNRRFDGMADPDQAPRAGKQVVSNLRLYGHISSERTQAGRTVRNQYKFHIFIKNTETGLLEWSAEEYIIKQGKRPVM
jgi:uncharacterized protein (TIGR02722 family)